MFLQYIPTEEQHVDILKNALSRGKFEFHRHRIGVWKIPFLLRGSVEKMLQERINLTLSSVKLSRISTSPGQLGGI